MINEPTPERQPTPDPAGAAAHDALLLLSFGGPEGPDDVMPFLENVVRGKPVPRERLEAVAEHYALFDGVSPINAQNRALLHALINELNREGPPLPVYWANLYWHPLLEDVLRQMAEEDIRRAACFVTSAYASYPGCRKYREAIADARRAVGPHAPVVEKLRLFYNHPGFVEPMAERLASALDEVPDDARDAAAVVFTAHSLPLTMAETCDYVSQLEETCRLVAERAGVGDWRLAYQSRSGPPTQSWLEPEVGTVAEQLAAAGAGHLVVAPIGFVSEHMEVAYDLDVELAEHCQSLGMGMTRAATVGCHPRFVRMIRELLAERIDRDAPRLALGALGPPPDDCAEGCCPPPEATRPKPGD